MVESIGYVVMTLTLVSFGCFAWFKYREERRCNQDLTARFNRLTMENYNLKVARTNIVPINRKTKSGATKPDKTVRKEIIVKTIASLLTGLALLCVGVFAQGAAINVGLHPTFANIATASVIKNTEIRHQDDLGLNKNAALYEMVVGVYTQQASIRAYYLFPITMSADGLLPAGVASDAKDATKDKALAVNSTYTLNANRIELAIPFRVNRLLLVEPIFLYQTISPSITITGKDYSFNHSPKFSTAGCGLEITENVSRNSVLRFKYLATPKMSYFEAKYLIYDRNMFFGGGYSCWSYIGDNLNARIQCPIAEVGFYF